MSLASPPEYFKQTTAQLRGHFMQGGHALGDRLQAIKRPRRDKRLGGGEDGEATARMVEKLTTIIAEDDEEGGVEELVSRWVEHARQPGGGLFGGAGDYLNYHKDGQDFVCTSGVSASGEELFNLALVKSKHINIVQQPASYGVEMLRRLGQTAWLDAATLHTPFAVAAFLDPAASLTAAECAWMRITARALLTQAMGQEAPHPPTVHNMPWGHKQGDARAFRPVEPSHIRTESVLLLDPRSIADGVPRCATTVAADRGSFVQTPFREYTHGAGANGILRVCGDEREARATHHAARIHMHEYTCTRSRGAYTVLLLLTGHHCAHRCSALTFPSPPSTSA